MPQRFHRRSIRLKGYDYTLPGAYFITLVTGDRLPLFGEVRDGEMKINRSGEIVRREWERLPRRFPYVWLGNAVVMPNHFHGIIIIEDTRAGAGRGAGVDIDQNNPGINPCARTAVDV